MTPAGSVSSQRGQGAPPLPPRPQIPRRPVPTPGSSSSSSPFAASPTQSPRFRDQGNYSSRPVQSQPPPAYNFDPPEDPAYSFHSQPTYNYNYGYDPPTEPSPSMRSQPSYGSSSPEPRYAPSPPQGPAQPQERRHSSFSSSLKKLAKVAFLESLSPGLSATMAADTSGQPQAAPVMGQNPAQTASCPGMPGGGQVIVNGVTLGPADVQKLQSAIGTVIPGNYWSVSNPFGTSLHGN